MREVEVADVKPRPVSPFDALATVAAGENLGSGGFFAGLVEPRPRRRPTGP